MFLWHLTTIIHNKLTDTNSGVVNIHHLTKISFYNQYLAIARYAAD